MINYPCKECTARHLGCHSTCESYLASVEKAEKERIARLEHKKLYDTLIDSVERMKKKRKHYIGKRNGGSND